MSALEKFRRRMLLLNKSDKTIKNYLNSAKKFLNWLENNNLTLENVNEDTIESWLYYMLDELEYKPATIHRHFMAVKLFLETMDVQVDWKRIPLERKQVIMFTVLSEDDVYRIIGTAKKVRDKLMLFLGYECALRAGELVRLKVSDVDIEEKTVRVIPLKHRDKTPHTIPYTSDEITNLYVEYVSEEELKPNDWLFPGKPKDNPMNPSYFTTNIFRPIVKKLGLDEKYGKHIRYHDFARHTRATLLLKKGVDIYTVNRLLRHKMLETTTVYLHLVAQDLRERLLHFS